MEETKWYEKLKNRCWNCKVYAAKRFIGEFDGFYNFKCRFCGSENRRKVIKGSWEMKDGKTFVNGIESELKRNLKGELFIGAIKIC